MNKINPEQIRLNEPENTNNWRKWGPYLSERQWGTVREDYSEFGSAWEFFPHDHARSRAYRWGEDGIAGISDEEQLICFAPSFWNGKDTIIKERLFGLTGNEGNHSEDVKELYYYLDNTPTHSYMRYLYKYPQTAFPYARLIEENATLTKLDPEYELADTGIFDKNNFFDINIEYAKTDIEEILICITAHNRSSEAAGLHILPTIWFRNTWSWGEPQEMPALKLTDSALEINHPRLGQYTLEYDGSPEVLFTDNETNATRLFGLPSRTNHVKDAFHEYLVAQRKEAVNPAQTGTKAALDYSFKIEPNESASVRLILKKKKSKTSFKDFDALFELKKQEADLFYQQLQQNIPDEETKKIQRQALAGMLWGKQYYNFSVKRWLDGDPGQFPPSAIRKKGRNHLWQHIDNHDIISMPDKWEYPWYAAWDSAFHCITLAHVDPAFAKSQLKLFTEDRYMNFLGQIPAYEWAFGDVNPPVHAYGTWKVFLTDKDKNNGKGDLDFLQSVYFKLQRNYSWWFNSKAIGNKPVFGGGFLGLDNVGVLDRGTHLPEGAWMEQLDGTSWMALYSLNMMKIALELSSLYPHYEEQALFYLQNFLRIAHLINDKDNGFWNEDEGIFYELNIRYSTGKSLHLSLRNIVYIMALFPVESISAGYLEKHPQIKEGIDTFLCANPEFRPYIRTTNDGSCFFSVLSDRQFSIILGLITDESEFLSPYGIRSLSKYYQQNPFEFELAGEKHSLIYRPAESDTEKFGENSNWRGPVWFPVNYLIIDALLKYYQLYGDHYEAAFPSIPAGKKLNINQIAHELAGRLIKLFKNTPNGMSIYKEHKKVNLNNSINEQILFFEFFNGDNGSGCGASHQTGWTGLTADLIFMLHPYHK